MQTVTVTDVVRNFTDYIGRVAYRREAFVLLKGNKPVAELRPVPAGRTLGDLPGVLAALPSLGEDDGFGAEIDAARVALDGAELADPWE